MKTFQLDAIWAGPICHHLAEGAHQDVGAEGTAAFDSEAMEEALVHFTSELEFCTAVLEVSSPSLSSLSLLSLVMTVLTWLSSPYTLTNTLHSTPRSNHYTIGVR